MSSEAIEVEHKFVQNHLKVCRLCLSEELLEDIFKCDDLNLWILDFLSIVVSEDDKISCSICVLCRARLNEFHDFQQRCLEVQDVLLHLKYSTPFEEDLSLSVAEKRKLLSDAHSELTIDAREKLQPTIPDLEDETNDDEKRLHQRVVTTRSKQTRYYYKTRKIECSTCGDNVYKSNIEGHQNRHKGVRPFKCERGCKNVDFDNRKTQFQHHRDVHSEERYECNICNKVFWAKRNLNMHKISVHSSRIFLCSVCNFQITTRSGLHKHMKRMHDPNRKREYSCSHCNRSFKTNAYLQLHLHRMHRIGMPKKSKKGLKRVLGEDQDFLEAPKVKNEPDADDEAEEVKIEPDSNPEQGKDDYNSTIEGDHSLLELEEPKISNQTFDIQNALHTEHVLKSQKRTELYTPFEKDLPLSVVEKGKLFSEAHPQLTINAREKLQPTIPDLEDETDEDEKRFNQRIVITRSGQKQYNYDVKKTYQKQKTGEKANKYIKADHQNRHTGVRSSKCERGCGNADFCCQQTQFHHHREVHSEERYECNICKKVFRAYRHLRKHNVDFHSSKTFLCSICNLKLTSKYFLHRHMRKVHDRNRKRKFPCPHCNLSFTTNGFFQLHLYRMHRIEMLEKSTKGLKRTNKVEDQDLMETPKVKNEPDADSRGGQLDLFEAEEAKIEPVSSPEQGQDDLIYATEDSFSLLESERLNISDQAIHIKNKLHAQDVLKFQKRTKSSTPFEKKLPLSKAEIRKPSLQSHPKLTMDAREELQPKELMCSICDLQLTSQSGLHIHMQMHLMQMHLAEMLEKSRKD